MSRERIARKLDRASELAEQQGNPSAIVSAELGIAKIFGIDQSSKDYNPQDYSTARTMRDVATRLLQSVGFREPTEAAIELAMAANDTFVVRIEQIRAEHDPEYDDAG